MEGEEERAEGGELGRGDEAVDEKPGRIVLDDGGKDGVDANFGTGQCGVCVVG